MEEIERRMDRKKEGRERVGDRPDNRQEKEGKRMGHE